MRASEEKICVVLQEVGRQPLDDQRQAARRPRLVPQALPRGLGRRLVSVGHHDPRRRLLGADAEDGRLDAASRRQGGRPGAGRHVRCDAGWSRTAAARVVPARSGSPGLWPWKTPEGGALLYTGGKTPTGGKHKGAVACEAARRHARCHGLAARRRKPRSGRSSEEREDRPATGRRSSSCPRRAAGY